MVVKTVYNNVHIIYDLCFVTIYHIRDNIECRIVHSYDYDKVHHIYSDGWWSKHEYGPGNEEIYYEDGDGIIIDSRPNKK